MQKNKLPSIVTILILTLITAIAWLIFSVYRTLTLKPSPVVPEEISKPLSPTLDGDTINKLQTKLYFEESQIPEINPTK